MKVAKYISIILFLTGYFTIKLFDIKSHTWYAYLSLLIFSLYFLYHLKYEKTNFKKNDIFILTFLVLSYFYICAIHFFKIYLYNIIFLIFLIYLFVEEIRIVFHNKKYLKVILVFYPLIFLIFVLLNIFSNNLYIFVFFHNDKFINMHKNILITILIYLSIPFFIKILYTSKLKNKLKTPDT